MNIQVKYTKKRWNQITAAASLLHWILFPYFSFLIFMIFFFPFFLIWQLQKDDTKYEITCTAHDLCNLPLQSNDFTYARYRGYNT